MNLPEQIELCSEHYQKWKNLALKSVNPLETKKCMEKAFFWLELQSAFVVLYSVEQTQGTNKEARKRIIQAKANLSKKLADYANETLNEMNI